MSKKLLAVLMTLFLVISTTYSIFNIAQGAMAADSMFLDPTTISFTTDTANVGTKFNVTVWLNLTTPANSWQFYLTYDKSQLNATRCDYTGAGKSQWSKALLVNTVLPAFGEHNTTHNYVLHGEALKSSAVQTGAGTLSWVEFQIIKAPPSGQTLASDLRLDLLGPFNTLVMDADFNPITVNFGKALYSFASTAPTANYTLTITASTGGTTVPAPGKYSYNPGTQVSVTATPDASHLLDHWELDGTSVGATNPTTVTMDQNHTLHAEFITKPPEVNYTLTITASVGGTTNPVPGTYSYKSGTSASVQAIPDATHVFDHWELDTSNIGATNPVTVTMNQNHTLNATFVTKPPEVNYTLTITTTAGGTTNPAPGNYSYKSGTTVSVQALPDTLFVFDHWKLDTVNVGATNPITVTMNNNHTLNAAFVSKPPAANYTLTITTSIGGTTNPSPGMYSYISGTIVSVTAIPNTGYKLDRWELDGLSIGAANPTTVTMNENHTLHAEFVTKPPLPLAGPVKVEWANLTDSEHPIGNPQYPFGGQYHSGQYSVWKNFTVINGANDSVDYISVKYPDATPEFKPSRYRIITIPDDQCWVIKVNTEDRLIEFIAKGEGVKAKGGAAIVSIEFIEGPTAEDCITGKEFAVTVSGISCNAQTFYLSEYIDKTPPEANITFPNATTPGGMGYVFVKKSDGSIWVQMPNCTNKNIDWLWINGTASDDCSGINRIEIWINGTYMGDAILSGRVMSRQVSWWWYVDPTKNPQFWKHESWYYVIARAYDNSVNDEQTIPAHGAHPRIPLTNTEDTTAHWFFWLGTETTVQLQDQPMPNGKMISWVPGNGRVDVNGTTGFYPNGRVDVWLVNKLYGIKILLTNVTADNYGRFYVAINHLPEVPRKPMSDERWNITAVDIKGNWGSDLFLIIPWITYENTLAQIDPATWQTTMKGHVGDTITVYGHGFLPSRQAKWDPNSDVHIRVVYTDVAPLEKWDSRRIFNGTSQFRWDNLKWTPRLSEVVLAEVKTDANGYWSAQITIPQSFGGLHAIYAYEFEIVTDTLMLGPNPPPEQLVRSGWPECTMVEKEEQAAIFDVWPTITLMPSTAIADQYVTITGEGLPLPRYYKLWKNGNTIVGNRSWSLVLDFGPYTQWVWEAKRIRNNELDFAWANKTWYPFAFYSPDIAQSAQCGNSPVWKGKLASVTKDFVSGKLEFTIGSKYLKVPLLAAGQYQVMVYYFEKNTEAFVYDHNATTQVTVLKDPLHVSVEVGKIHLPNEMVSVFAQVDVDGMYADATTLSLELYRGETLVQGLAYKRIGNGAYVANFTCPSEAGDYFIKAFAGKDYQTFSLHGSAIAGFTVNPTISDINARLIALDGKIATLQTDLGQVKLDFSTANATLIDVEGKVATIQTSMGKLQADVSAIDGKIIAIEGTTATIETNVGTLQTNISTINGVVTSIKDGLAIVMTDIGTVKANVTRINAVMTQLSGDVVTLHTAIGDLQAKLEDLNSLVTIKNDIATIKTEVGDIQGKVLSIEGDTATIKTEIGTIKTKADTIQGNVGLQPVTIALSLFAALAAIAVAVLILRKVYLE